MKLKNFYITFFNPLKDLNQALYQGKTATSLMLVSEIKNKKVNNILFNETLSLAIIKGQKEVALKLITFFPQMDIEAGYRSDWLTQDPILNLACVVMPHANELILKLISKTQKINEPSISHSSQLSHYPNALYAYLENSQTRTHIELNIIEELVKKGVSIFEEKEILVANYHYEKCNCLDLALLTGKFYIVNYFLNTDLATVSNIEHAKMLYELKSFAPEKNNQLILKELNKKAVETEKKQLENTLNAPATPSATKKIKI